ncbi:MAG: hypothetical protein AABM31_01650 [Actinomycetota bacterium]
MDKGYDIERVYGECAERGTVPVIPLRQTTAVKRGEDKPPTCLHGEWRFAGAGIESLPLPILTLDPQGSQPPALRNLGAPAQSLGRSEQLALMLRILILGIPRRRVLIGLPLCTHFPDLSPP